VYTCREACALLFGGNNTDYCCSTTNPGINRLAWADGWGDMSHCQPGGEVSEDFEQPAGGTYDCGAFSCSVSAYVMDHGCANVNYCVRP
jgi:hypothetical protein